MCECVSLFPKLWLVCVFYVSVCLFVCAGAGVALLPVAGQGDFVNHLMDLMV